MASKEWYIRVRDKVTGPFDVAEIQKFRDRGLLQPYHEVSRDRQTWSRAESIQPPPEKKPEAPALEVDLDPPPDIVPAPDPAAEAPPPPRPGLLRRWGRELAGAGASAVVFSLVGFVLWHVGVGEGMRPAPRSDRRPQVERQPPETPTAPPKASPAPEPARRDDAQAKQMQQAVAELKQSLQTAEEKARAANEELEKARAAAAETAARARKAEKALARNTINSEKEIQMLETQLERLNDQLKEATRTTTGTAATPTRAAGRLSTATKEELDKLYEDAQEAMKDMREARTQGDLTLANVHKARVLRLCRRLEDLSGSRERTRILRRILDEMDRGR